MEVIREIPGFSNYIATKDMHGGMRNDYGK